MANTNPFVYINDIVNNEYNFDNPLDVVSIRYTDNFRGDKNIKYNITDIDYSKTNTNYHCKTSNYSIDGLQILVSKLINDDRYLCYSNTYDTISDIISHKATIANNLFDLYYALSNNDKIELVDYFSNIIHYDYNYIKYYNKNIQNQINYFLSSKTLPKDLIHLILKYRFSNLKQLDGSLQK